MRINADTSHLQNNLTLQHSAGDIVPQRKQSPVGLQAETRSRAVSSPSGRSSSASVSYNFKNTGLYPRALRAYQEASRFGNHSALPLSIYGDRVHGDIHKNETALTGILRDDPQNSAAWYDLGLLYALRGDRDKVSAVYQVLQKLDYPRSEEFSTYAGLNEKLLLDVI